LQLLPEINGPGVPCELPERSNEKVSDRMVTREHDHISQGLHRHMLAKRKDKA